MDNQWSRLEQIVRSEIGESAFDRWIKVYDAGRVGRQDGDDSCATAAISSWVRQNYRQRLQQLWRDLNPDVAEVAIASPSELDAEMPDEEPSSLLCSRLPSRTDRIGFGVSTYFILDDSNRVACSVARALPDTTSRYGPLTALHLRWRRAGQDAHPACACKPHRAASPFDALSPSHGRRSSRKPSFKR